MRNQKLTIEEKVDRLNEQIENLHRRVAELEGRRTASAHERSAAVSGARPGAVLPPAVSAPPGKPPGTSAAGEPDSLSDEVIHWASRASLFPRLATLCFLMVVALILRTITDNGIVNPLLGMAIGMGYAAALMVTGWYQYRRGSSLAPVFVASGAILMSSIVVETHARFGSLPLVPAYWTLMATGTGMAFVSRRFSVFLPVSVGTLGMCLAGAAIDYPDPFFPYLFMILLTANLLGYYAGTLKRCGWLRWTVLLVTLAMFLLWGMRLAAVVAHRTTAAPTLAPGWFLPVLATLSAAFLAIALLGIVRSRDVKVSVFDYCLPTISAVGSYLAARVVVSEADGSALALNLVAILFALVHFGAAFWLAMRKIDGVPGTNSFVVAGAALLGLALPAAIGSVPAAPVLGAAAFGVAVLSGRWGSGAIRVTSYLLQIYGVVSLALNFQTHGLPASLLDRDAPLRRAGRGRPGPLPVVPATRPARPLPLVRDLRHGGPERRRPPAGRLDWLLLPPSNDRLVDYQSRRSRGGGDVPVHPVDHHQPGRPRTRSLCVPHPQPGDPERGHPGHRGGSGKDRRRPAWHQGRSAGVKRPLLRPRRREPVDHSEPVAQGSPDA